MPLANHCLLIPQVALVLRLEPMHGKGMERSQLELSVAVGCAFVEAPLSHSNCFNLIGVFYTFLVSLV